MNVTHERPFLDVHWVAHERFLNEIWTDFLHELEFVIAMLEWATGSDLILNVNFEWTAVRDRSLWRPPLHVAYKLG